MIEHRQIRTEDEVASLLQSIMKEALRRFPALIPYKQILEFVFTAFYRQDGLIFFKENEEGAYISPDMVYGQYVYHLNIGIMNRTNPITVLWSILHEYGHTLQEIRTEAVRLNPMLTLARETDAWDKAEQLYSSGLKRRFFHLTRLSSCLAIVCGFEKSDFGGFLPGPAAT